ncbi:MAG TPA: PaaX family transcriptional regulator C-terminal domain-containing protein [Pseudonocardiaceae bacterium]|jgi:phenylacetic acid degradation operon negative regulatory protein
MDATADADQLASRRHQAGGSSARALLMTVLGEFVLPRRTPVWTRTLVDVLSRLGVEEKTARQSLARTAADGWLTSHRDGRRVCWSLTEEGGELLSEGARRIYGFGAPDHEWDGRWLVLNVTVPESQRRQRHRLRSRLAWAGLGSPAPGVWISPDADKEPEVARVLAEQGLSDLAFSYLGRFGSIGEPQAVVSQAWDLGGVEADYEAFVTEFDLARPGTADETLAAQVRLVHAWRRFPFIDPQLPEQLLPAHWAGTRAAEVFRRRHQEWHDTAQRRWDELASAGPAAVESAADRADQDASPG